MQTATIEQWREAWANILAAYRSGAIGRHQFLKERDYMQQARAQIERHSKEL